MSKATTTCIYQGKIISVEQALGIREASLPSEGTKPVFTCVECQEPVRPLRARASGSVVAHIQHSNNNPACSLSPKPSERDRNRKKSASPESIELFFATEPLPDEVPDSSVYSEGSIKIIEVNSYERNPRARLACLRYHGYTCTVCGMDFGSVYGDFAKGYMHIHHLVPLNTIRSEYEVDPVNDLVPVCPNCHAAIHLGGKTRGIEEVRALLGKRIAAM